MKVRRRQERRGEGTRHPPYSCLLWSAVKYPPPRLICLLFFFFLVGCCLFSPHLSLTLSLPAPCSILIPPVTPDAETERCWLCYAKCLQLLAQRECVQFYFCLDAKRRKLSDVYVQQFLTRSTHRRLLTDLQVERIGQQRKENCSGTFCAYKAWSRMEQSEREYTKVIMSPPFHWWGAHLKLPGFLLQRQKTHQVSSECAFTASTSSPHRRRSDFPLPSLGDSRRGVHPPARPSPTESPSIVSRTPSWRISPRYKRRCRCMSVRATVSRVGAPLVTGFFMKESYLKWNQSWAACGKHCRVRKTAKPYKAFPPKGST